LPRIFFGECRPRWGWKALFRPWWNGSEIKEAWYGGRFGRVRPSEANGRGKNDLAIHVRNNPKERYICESDALPSLRFFPVGMAANSEKACRGIAREKLARTLLVCVEAIQEWKRYGEGCLANCCRAMKRSTEEHYNRGPRLGRAQLHGEASPQLASQRSE